MRDPRRENINRLGKSFWVGDLSEIAGHSLRDVETLQQGVIGLKGGI
jgi:hypothetical protein